MESLTENPHNDIASAVIFQVHKRCFTVAYAVNFHGVGFIQWHTVVICIWCALFVTSQFDVILMFPNQRFGEFC